MLLVSLFLVSLGLVVSQDTYHCPDGWLIEEDRSGCRCFLLGPDEKVPKNHADILCATHGGWVAELDHPGINYWLKAKMLDASPVGERADYWLGATTKGYHNENHWGEWTWPHKNQTVKWFDWANNEPNDYHNENCLVMHEYYTWLPLFRDYYWNDKGCDTMAHYICQKECQ